MHIYKHMKNPHMHLPVVYNIPVHTCTYIVTEHHLETSKIARFCQAFVTCFDLTLVQNAITIQYNKCLYVFLLHFIA